MLNDHDTFRLQLDAARDMVWKAHDMDKKAPYICISDCQLGYTYMTESKKCVKAINMTDAVTQGDAMVKCAKDNARLAHAANCQELQKLAKDVWSLFQSSAEAFWFGFFVEGFDQYTFRRIPISSKSVSSKGLKSSLESCGLLVDETDSSLGSIPSSVDGMFGAMKFLSNDPASIKLQMSYFKQTHSTAKKG